MNHLQKYLIVFSLSTILAFSFVSIVSEVFDAEDVVFTEGDYTYMVQGENRVIITANSKTSGMLSVPSNVIHNNVNYTVVGLGDEVFLGFMGSGQLVLPDTIESIG